ncbi:MAG: FadR family transcriptional regulator [Ardenticatenaceae bacterium]|nr:FadR family transcriptional regulator [Anaerolineales bacterium]MCB8977900.1 FadR family transcriptional regulator [Ardenticatenaceae bacterium]
MRLNKLDSAFLRYLVDSEVAPGERLPTLNQIGKELGVSVGKLREQLEIARGLGLVSVRPRVGIVREPFDFSQAVLASVLFGLGTGEAQFKQFSDLRQAIEIDFWETAVRELTPEDKKQLQMLVEKAWAKLKGSPIHVPNEEHRQLHLTIFCRLENPFVQGMLAAYWDAYEASELTRFSPYDYWLEVWEYHEKIVEAIVQDDFASGLLLLKAHFGLLPELASGANGFGPG